MNEQYRYASEAIAAARDIGYNITVDRNTAYAFNDTELFVLEGDFHWHWTRCNEPDNHQLFDWWE